MNRFDPADDTLQEDLVKLKKSIPWAKSGEIPIGTHVVFLTSLATILSC